MTKSKVSNSCIALKHDPWKPGFTLKLKKKITIFNGFCMILIHLKQTNMKPALKRH